MELRLQMVQYVEGYILACEDVLRDIDEIVATSASANNKEALSIVQRIAVKVQESRTQARTSLRLWKGLTTNEQEAANTQTDGVWT